MPELATIYAELLNGAVSAVARAETERLAAHVEMLRKLDGKTPGVDDLLRAYQEGYLPDHFVAAELQVSAQLTMTTARERTIGANGGLEFGPLRLEGSLTETFQQGTTTNLSVTCTLVRQARSKGIENTLSALSPAPVNPVPLPSG
jgi:hypothetical protein